MPNKSGELMLSELQMFNEAAVMYNTIIEPKFKEGIDKCVENFSKTNKWLGEFKFEIDDDCWLAPKSWCANSEETTKNSDFKATFYIDCFNDEDDVYDYWSALFCCVAVKNGKAGFSFEVNHQHFNGKSSWNTYTKSIPAELTNALAKLGFENKGKGVFFLPVCLDNKKFAQGWFDYGKFDKGDDAFLPLYEAMDTLKKSVPIFDKIMKGYK